MTFEGIEHAIVITVKRSASRDPGGIGCPQRRICFDWIPAFEVVPQFELTDCRLFRHSGLDPEIQCCFDCVTILDAGSGPA